MIIGYFWVNFYGDISSSWAVTISIDWLGMFRKNNTGTE